MTRRYETQIFAPIMFACYIRGSIKQLAYLQVTLHEAKRDSDRHSTRLVRSTAPERKGGGKKKKRKITNRLMKLR